MPKNIDFAPGEKIAVHRLVGRMPEFHKKYGLWIIGVSGAFHFSSNWFANCQIRKFDFFSLSHVIAGKGRIWMENRQETQILPGHAILIPPGLLNRYGGHNADCYVEDSVRFCGPMADMLLRSGVIRPGVYDIGTVRRIPLIGELAQDSSPTSQMKANLELLKLLTEIRTRHCRKNENSSIDELLELIKSKPEHRWTVTEMAELCSLSTDQLRRNFYHATGMMPKNYIESYKLRLAAESLANTLLPVGEIAGQLGFIDPLHFSRRFKLAYGMSPEYYRRETLRGGLIPVN